MFLSDPVELLVVAVCALGLGALAGRTWGVRRLIRAAVNDAEVAARTDPQTGLWKAQWRS